MLRQSRLKCKVLQIKVDHNVRFVMVRQSRLKCKALQIKVDHNVRFVMVRQSRLKCKALQIKVDHNVMLRQSRLYGRSKQCCKIPQRYWYCKVESNVMQSVR